MNLPININSPNVITGDEDNYLSYWLERSIKLANRIDIIVSFLMESGVKMLVEDLKEAVDRGAEVRIITGNYLSITQPQALYLLRDVLGDKIKLRFYSDGNKSFHPKSYIFHYEDDGEIYIGSSNISRGALTNSIEWNYRLTKSSNEKDFRAFEDSFNGLWKNHSYDIDDNVLASYARSWIRPKIYKKMFEEDETSVVDLIEPRGAQIEALYELKKTREEGFDKALVIASTGIGKTYLAAFDSKEYDRVLFVAHREEIIKQAMNSFSRVSPKKTTGLFYADQKEYDRDVVFAIVNTLGKDDYLNDAYFKKDAFDYIIIDEFHHAAANTYKRVLDYFEPKFLLGLTATPERMDNKDVFELCDYNVAYEIRLKESINRGELVPFDYYGIHDDTVDYDIIEFRNGRYNDQELEQALQIHKRADKILQNFDKYGSKRSLGFCTSKAHAEYMSKFFNESGIASAAVYSGEQGEHTQERDLAITNLKNGDLRVVFSVDMFNEGLDVPSIDLVMFLRPTQSPTIFLQQLGRGLRKSRNKEKLTVIDFIGNYKKAHLIPFLLSGKPYNTQEILNKPVMEYQYPEECHIDFDLQVINIFKKLAQRDLSIKDMIKQEYYRVKEMIGKRPARTELFIHMDEDVYSRARRSASLNPFKDYLGFLDGLNELSSNEIKLKDSFAGDFITMVEKTSMSKTYKMPVLLSFYNDGDLKMEIEDEDLFKSFKEFYSKASNAVDMLKDFSTEGFREWGKEEYIGLAKRNPVKFLVRTENDFFYINEEGNMCLNDALRYFRDNKVFLDHFIDAINLRTKEFYRNRLEKKMKELGIE